MHKDKNPAPDTTATTGRRRKPYQKPRLIHHGDVRDVTMGPTPGIGESGNPTTFRP